MSRTDYELTQGLNLAAKKTFRQDFIDQGLWPSRQFLETKDIT